MYKMMAKAVEKAGRSTVIVFITDSAPVNEAAGKLLMDK
jgi:hypothetical protein